MSTRGAVVSDASSSDLSPADCARELLTAVRSDGSADPYLATLAAYDDGDLARVRSDRDAARAFWTNLYNAGTQLLLARRPELYDSSLRFLRFFGTDCLTVAGVGLSLDDIEHGILRSRSKYGLGYLPRLLPDTFEVRHALDDPDPRVHFALNCGAASCPAIRFYEADAVDEQLSLATATYLESAVAYDPEADVARLPRLFRWYWGDFGGAAGIRDLLRRHDVVPADAEPTLRTTEWDWSRDAEKFAD